MVGLGTQDSFEDAQDFRDDTGTRSFPMLWDEGFESWRQLKIAGQPAAILVAPDGRRLRRWVGMYDEAEVLRLVRGR